MATIGSRFYCWFCHGEFEWMEVAQHDGMCPRCQVAPRLDYRIRSAGQCREVTTEPDGFGPSETGWIGRGVLDELVQGLQKLNGAWREVMRVSEQLVSGPDAGNIEDDAEAILRRLVCPLLDALEETAAKHPETVGPLYDSSRQFAAEQGLERITPLNQPFDPTEHQALGDGVCGMVGARVVEVVRTGYRWKGRILRPAAVRTRAG